MKKREIVYKTWGKESAFFVGSTVKDCYYIDHFMSHSPDSAFHYGIFYETALHKLKMVAEIHGCILREEKK